MGFLGSITASFKTGKRTPGSSNSTESTMETSIIKYTVEFVRMFFTELAYASPILVSLFLLIGLIGYVIGRIEGWSSFDGWYHAFINAATVGYGDLHPTKKLSKILAVALAIVGLVFTGIIIAVGLHAADRAINAV